MFQEISSSWTNSDALYSLRHFMKSSWMSWEIMVKCSNVGLLLKRRTGKRNKAEKKTTGKMKRYVRQKGRVGLMHFLHLADCLFFVLFRFPVVRWYWKRSEYTIAATVACMPLHEAAKWRPGMKTVNHKPCCAVKMCKHNNMICKHKYMVFPERKFC